MVHDPQVPPAARVRLGFQEDADALAKLRASWRGVDLTSEFVGEFTQWFRREGSSRWWWIAEVAGEPVGMVNLKVFDRMPSPAEPRSRWGYLGNLFVTPVYRGGGIGGQLIEVLLARAAQERLVRVVLSPSIASVPLYMRHGFVAADELLVRRLS